MTTENELQLFPYKPRRYQKEITTTILDTIKNKKTLVIESGTGSGKTICAVSQSIAFALENNKKILYLTRTNAQQRQVLLEVRRIKESFPDLKERLLAVGLQGRSHTCLLAREDPELMRGSADELARFCSEMKKKNDCDYFENITRFRGKIEKMKEWIRGETPTVEEILDRCRSDMVCPYEMIRMMVEDATLVVAPYIYVFNDNLRNILLDHMGVSEDDIVLIVDEAHNLPDYIRDSLSTYLSIYMLNQCISESERFGDPVIWKKSIKLSEFLLVSRDIIDNLRGDFLREGSVDVLLPTDEFTSRLSESLGIDRNGIREIANYLVSYGEQIREIKQRENKLPRSYIYNLGVFILSWMDSSGDSYIRLLTDETDGKNPRIELFCLDPSIGAKHLHNFYASIHMSGTLSPLEEYRDSLGLPRDTYLISFPSPFPKNSRKVVYAPNVSTKYEEIRFYDKMVNRLKDMIVKICNKFKRNIIVFFPSFDLMNLFIDRGLLKDIKRPAYVERREMRQDELMEIVKKFKKGRRGNILLSVVGGRISEGMDFPADELEIAIIVGLPYPKPTAKQMALQRYYDMKFRRGWEYAVDAPTARKLLQSIGRLIRDENDRGIAVILDKRAVRFRKYLGRIKVSIDPIRDIRDFLGED